MTTRLTETKKVFFEQEKPYASNKNYGSFTTIIANLIFLANT